MLLVQLGRRLVRFWQNFQTSLVLLIPNCTRNLMITYTYSPIYYIHDKITAIWLVKRSAIISLIELSGSAINDFRDGWGEREIKTTKSNMAAKFR
jgi:hypothetical protein